MSPSSPAIHAALEAEDRAMLRNAWRGLFADHSWRRTPASVESDDQYHAETVSQALEAATEALENLLSWSGRRGDPDGRLLALVELIDLVRPGLQVGGESDPSE